MQLPVQFSDLAPTAVLAVTIVDVAGSGGQHHIVGGTTLPLFARNGLYRYGLYDLRVWSKVAADGRLESSTPGRPEPFSGEHQMQRLAKLTRKHHMGHIPQVDWLDRLSFREVELVNEREKTESAQMHMSVEFQLVESAGKLVSNTSPRELTLTGCLRLCSNLVFEFSRCSTRWFTMSRRATSTIDSSASRSW